MRLRVHRTLVAGRGYGPLGLAAVPAVVASVLLAGCGGSATRESADRPPDRPAPALAVPSPSPPTGEASAPSSAPLSAPPRGTPVSAQRFVGLISSSLDRSSTARVGLDITTPEVALAGHGAVDYRDADPRVRLWMVVPALGREAIEARLVGGVLYVTMPAADPSGTFFRVDLTDPDNPLGGISRLGTFDPRACLQALGTGVREVRLVGTEELGGQRLRHYWVRADGDALARMLGAPASTTTGLPALFDFEVWLGPASRVRRVTAALGAAGSLEIELTRWGAPVRITAPPPSDVQEMPRG